MNMPTEIIEILIEGGKATAAPPLGPALGPMGLNIGQVVTDINNKTQSFKGMQVPVKVEINTDTKNYSISVGTPPASQLIIKEAGIEKGSSNPTTDLVADLKIEQIIKIAKMKEDALLGKTNKEKVKEVMGTCQSMGVMVEGKPVPETFKEVEAGKFDEKIKLGKTELTEEELKELEEEKKKLQEEIAARREEFLTKASEVYEQNKDKELAEIKAALTEAEIPVEIQKEVLPEEEKEPEGEAPIEAEPEEEQKED
jgi:large subunit ribosomal protein L11